MRPPESRPSGSSQRRHPRWTVIAFYAGLLLLFAALNHFRAGGNGSLQDRLPPRNSQASERQQANDRPTATVENRAEKNRGGQSEPSSPPGPSRSSRKPAMEQSRDGENPLLIRNVSIKDENRRVVYRGDVDLAPTLKRIARGERLRFPNDGSVFQNRERRLPAKPPGYYHEFVQPTPGVGGPGAQRLVLGQEGEVYYTPDHYRSFRRIQ